MKTYKFSPTSLNLFRECPRCFWLQINKNFKRPRGPFPSLPTGMDRVIKEYFDGYRKKGEMPQFLNEIHGKLVPQAMSAALGFDDREKKINFYGYLDECLIMDDGTYAPLDHKTRASVPQDVHPAYRFQLNCYTFLLGQNDYTPSKKAFLVYYAPNSIKAMEEGIRFNTKVLEINTDGEEARKVIYEAYDCLQKEMPQPSTKCEFCAYRQDSPSLENPAKENDDPQGSLF